MKKIALILTIAFAFTSFFVNAQDEKPAPSPFCKTEQKVGTTDVTIEYSRPGVKDRKVFGELVPFGKMWRTGANAATKITFSKDVKVDGKDLAAGSYALFTTPGEESWEVHFFKHTTNSAGGYGDAKPALTVKASVGSLAGNGVETFLIFVDQLRDDSGQLMFVWENTFAWVGLGVM